MFKRLPLRQAPLTSLVNNAITTLCMCDNDNAENGCGKSASNEVTLPSCRYLRLVFSQSFYIRGNLRNVTEKPTRKNFFFREMKRLTLCIYLAKFC